MKRSVAKRLADRKRRIRERLRRTNRNKYQRLAENAGCVMSSNGVKYELSDKIRGIAYGGISMFRRLAERVGLVDIIDRRLHLLRFHLPYHESDHVLNFAFNALCEGTCLQDIELRRNDEVFLDALGADAIPDPTTAGDFCRRFSEEDVRVLLDAINHARLNAWQTQAEDLPETGWTKLIRPPSYQREGPARQRPPRVMRTVIRRRQYLHLELQSEEVAEFEYQPAACARPYRMIVVRKNISQEKGERRLLDEVRYFFYITNNRTASASEIVFGCNDRCDQENLIAHLASGVHALKAPVDNLISNWAYMVMTSLAWTLKAWAALWLPIQPRHRARHEEERQSLLRMEFRTFVHAFVKIPCQIVRQSRRTIHRVLNWNPFLPPFFRLCEALRC